MKHVLEIPLVIFFLIGFPAFANDIHSDKVEKNTTIHIAVASNFRSTLLRIIDAFHQTTDIKVTVSSASTGVLYAQISHGAPFDIFFSADYKTALKLAEQLTLPEPFIYALGKLVFWCPLGAPKTPDDISDWRGTYAMANPKLAPYGAAALEVTQHMHWPQTNTVITANNIAQTTQFVSTGNVSCGFIAQSLVPVNAQPNSGYTLPPDWYHPIEQAAVVLPSGNINSAVPAFLEFLKQQGDVIISADGYGLLTDKIKEQNR